jgi:DNA-binding MarR family transcriptional regulator
VNTPAKLPLPDSRRARLGQEVVQLLVAMSARLGQHFAARTGEFGLSPGEGKVLLHLEPGETLPMRALARKLHFDASNLTGLVDKLEDRGAVERRADPDDRRVKAIAATEAGLDLRERLWERLSADAGAVDSLTESQLRELRDLLKQAIEG